MRGYSEQRLYGLILEACVFPSKRPYYFKPNGIVVRSHRQAGDVHLHLSSAELASLSVEELKDEVEDSLERRT